MIVMVVAPDSVTGTQSEFTIADGSLATPAATPRFFTFSTRSVTLIGKLVTLRNIFRHECLDDIGLHHLVVQRYHLFF